MVDSLLQDYEPHVGEEVWIKTEDMADAGEPARKVRITAVDRTNCTIEVASGDDFEIPDMITFFDIVDTEDEAKKPLVRSFLKRMDLEGAVEDEYVDESDAAQMTGMRRVDPGQPSYWAKLFIVVLVAAALGYWWFNNAG